MTPTLPGSLPGLLRVGSPVVRRIDKGTVWAAHCHGVVFGVDGDTCGVVDLDGEVVEVPLSDVALDLTDPTGRIHALWWVEAQKPIDGRHAIDIVGGSPILRRIVLRAVTKGKELTGSEVDRFRRYCLSYAGVASV